MKMSSVIQPQTFLAGVGQYSYDEMLHGLSWVGATDDDMLSTLNGLGRMTYQVGGKQNMSVMDAIIRNAAEMNIKTSVVNKERMRLAKSDPQFALKLGASMKKTATPGTNVAAGVKAAAMDAAKKAMQAKVLEKKAKVLLHSGDKRAAAAQAVNALTAAREALTLATSAEKTRLTTSLDKVAHTLDEQAKYVESTVQNEMARSGPTGKTDALRASAQHLRSEASKARKASAVVAQAPAVPANAPTQQRIAEVANKFNIRAVGRGTQADVTSVLSDLSDSALAQVRDYDGAMKFYGNDLAGRLMADMEFDNYVGALSGLAGGVHSVGYVDILPVFAMGDRALAQSVHAAQKGFTGAVLPAFVGNKPGLQQMQNAAVQLGGLGQHKPLFLEDPVKAAERTAKWDRNCQSQFGVNGTLPDAEQLRKCMNPGFGCDMFEPWEAIGRACRGNIDIGTAIAVIGKGIVSGEVKIPKLPDFGGNQTPPPSTRPPLTIPTVDGGGAKTTGMSYGGGASYSQPGSYGLKASNTMLYAGIGLGVLALGTGVYWTMFRKAA